MSQNGRKQISAELSFLPHIDEAFRILGFVWKISVVSQSFH
jgi:hypothetical protein